jgi:hypothetical protein
MVELCFVTTPEFKCLFAMVNRIKYTPVADIVDYLKNVPKMLGPIECTSMVTWIAMTLRCPEMANLTYIEGDVPILGLDHFVQAHILREEPDHSLSMLYGRRRSVYLTWVLDCTLVKVLYCSLIGWERCAIASQDHLGLTGELAWRQHSRPRLHHRVTLRSPSGVDQAKHAVEGIRRLERRMDDFAHMQTEMHASIDSQASMMHDLFGHFRINPDA